MTVTIKVIVKIAASRGEHPPVPCVVAHDLI